MSSDQCKALINSGMTYWLWGVVVRVPGLGAGQAELTTGSVWCPSEPQGVGELGASS